MATPSSEKTVNASVSATEPYASPRPNSSVAGAALSGAVGPGLGPRWHTMRSSDSTVASARPKSKTHATGTVAAPSSSCSRAKPLPLTSTLLAHARAVPRGVTASTLTTTAWIGHSAKSGAAGYTSPSSAYERRFISQHSVNVPTTPYVRLTSSASSASAARTIARSVPHSPHAVPATHIFAKSPGCALMCDQPSSPPSAWASSRTVRESPRATTVTSGPSIRSGGSDGGGDGGDGGAGGAGDGGAGSGDGGVGGG